MPQKVGRKQEATHRTGIGTQLVVSVSIVNLVYDILCFS